MGRLLQGTTRDVVIGIGLAAAVLLIALAIWSRPSGISGTISDSICDPGAKTTSCATRPAAAQVRITDCYIGVLTSSNPRDNMTWDARTDSKGQYHVDLEPGTYCVVAFKDGPFQTTASQMNVSVRANQMTTVDLTLGFPVGMEARSGRSTGARSSFMQPTVHAGLQRRAATAPVPIRPRAREALS
jgi:hypothetical protein